MHMADALISPVVGGVGWALALGTAGVSVKKLKKDTAGLNPSLMGVGAAFVFAAQMINFAIPGTGSSGHIGGGLMLAAMLGPHAAFLAMASILTVQALFFADGGLLALGCNIFNLGFFSCFIAYPLIFRRMIGNAPGKARLVSVTVLTAVTGLLAGAFAVVLETTLSGVTALPFSAFAGVMLPIHLAIGLVEGFATAAVLLFVREARPDVLHAFSTHPASDGRVQLALLLATLMIGAVFSWFASGSPDGLEWSMEKTSGAPALESAGAGVSPIHDASASIQESTALLPEYGFGDDSPKAAQKETDNIEKAGAWPVVDGGTSLSGIIGALFTLVLAGIIGLGVRRRVSTKA